MSFCATSLCHRRSFMNEPTMQSLTTVEFHTLLEVHRRVGAPFAEKVYPTTHEPVAVAPAAVDGQLVRLW